MHDKAVRRRRAVLALLVAASLILLTAYFGESDNGRLHSVQRTALSALSPIQEGASRVLKPFRDFFGWFGDTLHAKSQRDAAIKARDAYRTQLTQKDLQLKQALEQAGLKTMDTTNGMSAYSPVNAQVFARSPNTWYQRVEINKGTSDDVHRGDPVINGTGLVGKVASVTGGSAVVELLTDQDFGVGAQTMGPNNYPGTISPAVGSTNDLLFDFVDDADKVRVNDLIYTSGTASSQYESRYPAGIPIGQVSKIDEGEGPLDTRIHVRPAADLQKLDLVQVLTQPHANLTASR
jgi:rod shape-determining protein MreC